VHHRRDRVGSPDGGLTYPKAPAELLIADNGSLDGYFQGSDQQLSTNTTDGTTFFSDGSLWESIAEAQGVGGGQWGVMNELWNFPGQIWLWVYTGMCQIPALNPSNNANLDLDVGLLMILFGFLLPMSAPWIPGINRIPRWIPPPTLVDRSPSQGPPRLPRGRRKSRRTQTFASAPGTGPEGQLGACARITAVSVREVAWTSFHRPPSWGADRGGNRCLSGRVRGVGPVVA
jgi:hypothetical protein